MEADRRDPHAADNDHYEIAGGTNPEAPISDLVRRIDDALRSMAPAWVRTGARAIDASDLASLWPSDRNAVSGAVAARRIEFASGRALLRHLIGDNIEIPRRPDRRPEFPAGITGTLAHDRDLAVAATATRSSCCALGIDIEPATVLDADVARLIRRPEERRLDAHLVFVLKEATYKAWSSLGGPMIDHQDVAVEVDDDRQHFIATIGLNVASFAGRYAAVAGRYVALVVVEENPSAKSVRSR